ncbi:MAG TPA: LEA type 2 family protein, partial [Gemmatimonadales bacterium]|nr:LEA type 2 family protein [Gemmatimonadales bacterium]
SLVVLSGCAGVGDFFREPELRLDHVVVRSIGLTGGTLDFAVDVHNPNSFDLRGTELRVGFDVENAHVGDVSFRQDFAVQRGDSTRLTLPVSFQWAGVGSAVRTALGYGEIPYKMSGEISLQTPFGRRAVPFTREGRAPLSRPGSSIRVPGTH